VSHRIGQYDCDKRKLLFLLGIELQLLGRLARSLVTKPTTAHLDM